MIRRTSALAGRSFGDDEESTNPMETVANVTDVMLVLAVALMLALLTRLGLDMSSVTQISPSDLAPVSPDVIPGDIRNAADNTTYEEVGKVYRDTTTGELYVLED